MKIFNKYFSLALTAAVGAGMLASCDNSKDNDYVSEYDGEPGIYFSNSENAYLELNDQMSTITYPAYRDVAGPAQTVGLSVQAMDAYDVPDIYTFPTSVTFPEGSKVGEITIGYDITKAALGEEQQYMLTLDATPNPFSSNSVVITLVNPAPWEFLGMGQYYDYGWGISPESAGPVSVAIYQQGVNKNIYRISNPYVGYNEETDTFLQIQVLQVGETYLGVDIDIPNLVAWNMFYINYDQEDQADVYLAFPGIFQGLDSASDWTNCSVVEYQEDGLPGVIQLGALYYEPSTGNAYGDLSPYVYIYFPGYVSYDADIDISYEGTLTTESQQEYVLLDATLGSDITEARAAVSNTLDANELVAALENGSIDYVSVSQSGSIKIPFEDQETGQYTAAVVGFVEGEAKSYSTLSFFYVASNSDYDPNAGWKSLGYVNYTDGFIVAGIFTGTSTITYRVEIQESTDKEGLFRLVNPYGTYFASFFGTQAESSDVPARYIYVDATDPRHVKVPNSDQTIVFKLRPEIGLAEVWSWASAWEEDGESVSSIEAEQVYGTYADGKITFPPFALMALWTDEPDQWYSANYALDYDALEAGSSEPIYYNEDGTVYAPFCIDMNTLSSEGPQPVTRASLPMASPKLLRSVNALVTRPMSISAIDRSKKTVIKKSNHKTQRMRKVK